MAGTVTTDQTEVHNCDAISDWTGTPTLDTEVYIEGTGSLSKKVSKATSDHMKTIASDDLSDTIIYAWILGGSIAQFDTKANGGIGISVSDGVNTSTWYVAGSDQGYIGGWQCLSVRTTTTPDVDGGVTMTAVTSVGVHFKVTASSSKINCWFDRIAYGTSITIYAGTSVSPATFGDIITAEATNKYGIFEEIEGILVCQGKLIIGSTSAGVDTYFKDTGKVIVFRDKPFGTFYNIKLQGNATAAIQEIYFGEKSGTRGISGCMFRSAGTSKFTITATDANILKVGFYGCIFYDAGDVSLPTSATNKEVIDCTFEKCGEIIASLCNVTYCNFVSSDGRGCRLSSLNHNVTGCNFINCPDGVNVSIAGTITFNALNFSGCTYDIEFSTTGDLTVNATNGSDPSTYEMTGGGTSVTIQNAVNITVTTKTSGGTVIENVRVRIEAGSGGALPAYESVTITRSVSTATVSHTAHGLVTGNYVIIRGAEQDEYNGDHQITYIDASSYSYTVSGTPATPATGTITSTARIMNELTNASGIATESFNYGTTQPIIGVARKASGSPYYKEGLISGDISGDGFTLLLVMVLDE